jgi:Glycosyl hydrolases family 16
MAPVKYLSLALLASISSVFAQTYTTCNPLTATCPADPGLNSGTFNTDFTTVKAIPAGWTLANQGSVTYDANGANFILAKQGDSPTMTSDGYIFFGSVEWVMQSAPGTGVVSSLILLSDDLDELDWVSLPALVFKQLLTIHRNSLVATMLKSSPTTLAREIPPPTTAPHGTPLHNPKTVSTATSLTGLLKRLFSPLMATLSALSTPPMLQVALVSPKAQCASSLVSGLAVIQPTVKAPLSGQAV